MTERAVGPLVIVIVAPGVQECLGVGEVDEAVDVQTLIAQAAVETLDKRVLHGLSGPDEVQGDPTAVGPLVQGVRRELRTVVARGRP